MKMRSKKATSKQQQTTATTTKTEQKMNTAAAIIALRTDTTIDRWIFDQSWCVSLTWWNGFLNHYFLSLLLAIVVIHYQLCLVVINCLVVFVGIDLVVDVRCGPWCWLFVGWGGHKDSLLCD